jgi:hypothetical protein
VRARKRKGKREEQKDRWGWRRLRWNTMVRKAEKKRKQLLLLLLLLLLMMRRRRMMGIVRTRRMANLRITVGKMMSMESITTSLT